MPPLRAPSGQFHVELHLKLYNAEPQAGARFELSEDEGFWQRHITGTIAGAELRYLSPTEQLLHLIVHAVYDHQFNNGPLLVSDLGYLLSKHDIDWPHFWSLARRGDHERGAVLTLRLIERYLGPQPIHWPPESEVASQVAPHLLDVAGQLMLRDFDAYSDVNLSHDLETQGNAFKKAVFLVRKTFPPKSIIATQYPVSEHSPWIYAWYPVRWWRLVSDRLPLLLSAQRSPQLQTEMAQLGQLNQWLSETQLTT
jgi:hypothetical protein